MGIWSKEYHEGYQQSYEDAKEEFKNIMCKYQKIQEIVEHWACCGNAADSMIAISEVLEDENENSY